MRMRRFLLLLALVFLLNCIQPAYSFFFLIGLLIQLAITVAQIAIEEAIEAKKRKEEEERERREAELRRQRQERWDKKQERFQKGCKRRCRDQKACRRRCKNRGECRKTVGQCHAKTKEQQRADYESSLKDIDTVNQQATQLMSSLTGATSDMPIGNPKQTNNNHNQTVDSLNYYSNTGQTNQSHNYHSGHGNTDYLGISQNYYPPVFQVVFT